MISKRGNKFLDTGIIYAPYISIETTLQIEELASFEPIVLYQSDKITIEEAYVSIANDMIDDNDIFEINKKVLESLNLHFMKSRYGIKKKDSRFYSDISIKQEK